MSILTTCFPFLRKILVLSMRTSLYPYTSLHNLNILVSGSVLFLMSALAMFEGPVMVPKSIRSFVSDAEETVPEEGLTLCNLKKPELMIAPVSRTGFCSCAVRSAYAGTRNGICSGVKTCRTIPLMENASTKAKKATEAVVNM